MEYVTVTVNDQSADYDLEEAWVVVKWHLSQGHEVTLTPCGEDYEGD